MFNQNTESYTRNSELYTSLFRHISGSAKQERAQ